MRGAYNALRKPLGLSRRLKPVKTLVSHLEGNTAGISRFQQEGFQPGKPLLITPDKATISAWRDGNAELLSRQWSSSFIAATRWFDVHRDRKKIRQGKARLVYTIRQEGELARHPEVILPYELVLPQLNDEPSTGNEHIHKPQSLSKEKETKTPHTNKDLVRFQQFQAPLRVLLEADQAAFEVWNSIKKEKSRLRVPKLYIAQAQIADLPLTLRETLLPPELVLKAGKGDIYDSNIWLGIAPTYTPLHKDPNPNLLCQVAGEKVVRLFPADIGMDMFEKVQSKLGSNGSANIRGEEMMQGLERKALHDAVWYSAKVEDGYEVKLATGDALFIPQGWWHSIKGLGEGVNMSVNWWFR